jgi:hypothetical protein
LFIFVFFLRAFLRSVDPFDSLVDSSFQLGLVGSFKLVCQFLVIEGVAEIVGVRFETVLRRDTGSCRLVLSWEKK